MIRRTKRNESMPISSQDRAITSPSKLCQLTTRTTAVPLTMMEYSSKVMALSVLEHTKIAVKGEEEISLVPALVKVKKDTEYLS